MDYKKRNEVVEEGIKLLKTGTFPNELIETIKDKRVRTELADRMFYPKGVGSFNELSEKKTQSNRLKVELAFVNYMSAIASVQRSGLIILMIGLMVTVASVINVPNNLQFGIITSIEGAVIAAMAINYKWIIDYHYQIILVLIGLIVLEFAIFQFPDSMLYDPALREPSDRRGGVLILVNFLSPYIYVFMKFSMALSLSLVIVKVKKFAQVKSDFEKKKY